jgi:hypothetical protein
LRRGSCPPEREASGPEPGQDSLRHLLRGSRSVDDVAFVLVEVDESGVQRPEILEVGRPGGVP